jgi:hypothetical protein
MLTVQIHTGQHPTRPWFNKRQGELVWMRAADIKAGDILVCAGGYYSQEETIGRDLARFVGAFLGDGWVRHAKTEISGYGVGLAIGAKEQPHTARYLEVCQRLFPEVVWNDNAPGAYGLTCSSRAVHRRLGELGLAERSGAKQVPEFAFSLRYEEKMALLAGYFDSDGSVASASISNHGRGTIASVSRELVEGLRELAIACGLQVMPVNHEKRTTNFGACEVFRCIISTACMRQLDLWHEDKRGNLRTAQDRAQYALFPDKIGYLDLPTGVFAQRIRSVQVSEEEEEVFDISVAHDNHAFVCEGVIVHNCWKESHDGRDLWVVRKGATPAFPGQKGFVGGSMGDISVILEGIESEEGRESLYSTVHGAGRVMSRTAARGKINRKTGEVISPGAVSREMMQAWVRKAGVELRGAGTDESPHCYKRIDQVLAHHNESIRILHTLTPLGVAMAGENEMDHYRD